MTFKPAPLNSTFFAISILGFLLSSLLIWQYSKPWATAFILVFVAMFLASLVSMHNE